MKEYARKCTEAPLIPSSGKYANLSTDKTWQVLSASYSQHVSLAYNMKSFYCICLTHLHHVSYIPETLLGVFTNIISFHISL